MNEKKHISRNKVTRFRNRDGAPVYLTGSLPVGDQGEFVIEAEYQQLMARANHTVELQFLIDTGNLQEAIAMLSRDLEMSRRQAAYFQRLAHKHGADLEIERQEHVCTKAAFYDATDGISGTLQKDELDASKRRVAELEGLINSPQVNDFLQGVRTEAAHQVERWGYAKDRSKSAENWFWLVGYLTGKALRAAITGDKFKAKHHTISSAAMLMNWHRAIAHDTTGAGVGQDADLVALQPSDETVHG